MASELAKHRQYSSRNWFPHIPRPTSLVAFLLFVVAVVLLVITLQAKASTNDLKGQVGELHGQVGDLKNQVKENRQETLNNRSFAEHSRIITCTLLRAQAPAVIGQVVECNNVGPNTP